MEKDETRENNMETIFSGQSWPTQWSPRISIREAIYLYLNAVSFLPLIFHIHAFTWPIERTWSIE